jgi:hypothetical protein
VLDVSTSTRTHQYALPLSLQRIMRLESTCFFRLCTLCCPSFLSRLGSSHACILRYTLAGRISAETNPGSMGLSVMTRMRHAIERSCSSPHRCFTCNGGSPPATRLEWHTASCPLQSAILPSSNSEQGSVSLHTMHATHHCLPQVFVLSFTTSSLLK